MPVLPRPGQGGRRMSAHQRPHVARCQSQSPSCSLLQQDEGGAPLQGGHWGSSRGQGLKRREGQAQASRGRREQAVQGPPGDPVPGTLGSLPPTCFLSSL